MIRATETYTAASIVSLPAEEFLTRLVDWANVADTVALCLTEGTYDPSTETRDRCEHSNLISQLWCESRQFKVIDHPTVRKCLAIIDRAIRVDVFPS